MEIKVDISPGELIDKMTILEIKAERITDREKLSWIKTELDILMVVCKKDIPSSQSLEQLKKELKEVNEILWDIEDNIRICEKGKNFGDRFVELARAVYVTNDKRSAVKGRINHLFESKIQEVKSYEDYN